MWHVLSITAFCTSIYRQDEGWAISSFRAVYLIIAVVDNTSGTVHTAFSCHILVSASLRSVFLELLGGCPGLLLLFSIVIINLSWTLFVNKIVGFFFSRERQYIFCKITVYSRI